LPSSAGSNQIEITTAPRVAGDSTSSAYSSAAAFAAVRDRRESFGVCCSFGRGFRLFPAANLGVELLAVFAPDQIVHRPAILRRRREVVCLDHFGHRATVPKRDSRKRRQNDPVLGGRFELAKIMGTSVRLDFRAFWEAETDPKERNKLLHVLFEKIWIDDGRVVAVDPRPAFEPFFAGAATASAPLRN
jgi:hypothetical protein